MKTVICANYTQKISEDSPLFMEPHERNHVEQVYQCTKEQLLCWGEESNYRDSEFCNMLERADQGHL